MLPHSYREKFMVEIIHRKAHIGTKVEMYRVEEEGNYTLDIAGELKRVKGKKKEPVRKPYVGMQLLIHLRTNTRKLVVGKIEPEYYEAQLQEAGKDVPCKLIWN